ALRARNPCSAGRSCSRSCARRRTRGTAPPSSRRPAIGLRIEAAHPSCNTPAKALCAPAKCRSVTYVSGMKCYPSLRKGIPSVTPVPGLRKSPLNPRIPEDSPFRWPHSFNGRADSIVAFLTPVDALAGLLGQGEPFLALNARARAAVQTHHADEDRYDLPIDIDVCADR